MWLEFNPQAGLRPAIVISPISYNEKVGLALICPITSKIKGYPFEVILPEQLKMNGAILSDQVKSLNWRVRKAKFISHAPSEIIAEVLAKLQLLIAQQQRLKS